MRSWLFSIYAILLLPAKLHVYLVESHMQLLLSRYLFVVEWIQCSFFSLDSDVGEYGWVVAFVR